MSATAEFKIGNIVKRRDRRICTKCRAHCGKAARCPHCGSRAEPRIQIAYIVAGKRCRELTNTWDSAEASQVLRQIEADYWRRQQIGAPDREIGGLLGELIAEFLTTKEGESENYKKQLRTATAALQRGLGAGEPVQMITAEDLVAFRDEGLTVLSPATVRSYLLCCRQFFLWCVERGILRKDPSERVKLPGPRARNDFLRPEEVGLVLEAFGKIAPSLKPIFATITLGGFRKGEVINLRRDGLDLDTRWAIVTDFEGDESTSEWTPKTAASKRAVPLHPLVVAELRQMTPVRCPDGQESPWVFPVVDQRKTERRVDARGRSQPIVGDRRSPKTGFFGRKLKECLEAGGVRRAVTVHGLRRTFAVLLTNINAPDSIIRQALGHSAKGVTEFNYLPRRDSLLQEWIDRIVI